MTSLYCTEGGARLDVFLTDETEFTRSHIKKLIESGRVTVCGVTADKAGRIVKTGDEVAFEDEIEGAEIAAQDIPLDTVYDDEYIAVIDKQRGLVVHPGAGNRSGTLVNALKFKYGDRLSCAFGAVRAGIVHRLDKDTTGLIVIAKTDGARAACRAVRRTHGEKILPRDSRRKLKGRTRHYRRADRQRQKEQAENGCRTGRSARRHRIRSFGAVQAQLLCRVRTSHGSHAPNTCSRRAFGAAGILRRAVRRERQAGRSRTAFAFAALGVRPPDNGRAA